MISKVKNRSQPPISQRLVHQSPLGFYRMDVVSKFPRINAAITCLLFLCLFLIPSTQCLNEINGGNVNIKRAGATRKFLNQNLIKKLSLTRNIMSNTGMLNLDHVRTKRSSASKLRSDLNVDRASELKHAANYMESIFWSYGGENASTLSMDSWKSFIKDIGLETVAEGNHTYRVHSDRHGDGQGNEDGGYSHHHDHDNHEYDHNRSGKDIHYSHADENRKCLTPSQLLQAYGLQDATSLEMVDVFYLCPAVLSHLGSKTCHQQHDELGKGSNSAKVAPLTWLYTMLSVLIISLCALFGILCIPRKGRNHDNPILQFLIALAMGTMSGDGMLHLIPHAIASHDHSGDAEQAMEEDEGEHLDALFKGLVALMGIYSFFFLERIFAILRTRGVKRRMSQRGVQLPMVRNGRDGHLGDDDDHHGHSHQGLFSCTSLASMIIVGDMFHNFCDGLAIGAAFAGSLSMGISTSIAVFCHELPHEIGDFAVLITSGMSSKRAIGFNLLSTVPCFLGAAIGLELGSLDDVTLWIFAFVGGLFLYISLVDLVPEMTKAYDNVNNRWQTFLIIHCIGMVLGVILMLILGIFEKDMQEMLV